MLSLLLLGAGCKKDEVTLSDIFRSLELSKTTASGDGAETVGIVCEINPDVSPDKQEFVLKTSMGSFVEGGEARLVKKPEFVEGRLVIITTAKVPLGAGNMVISVEPNQPLEKTDYIIKDSLTVVKSIAAALKLETSVLGIGSNYLTEAVLTGTLTNDKGGKVATGYKVIFEDYLPGGTPANGRFRDMKASSGADSKVSAVYGAGSFPVGTDIYLKATLLDENGLPGTIKDSLLVRINL
ncbi:hypothetical protein [Chitinophaga sp.]|uniref:hypothetical protein n=1 Tax=Chitinophaga sp. TaxID=1869181 RepID=UPI0031DD934D